MAFYRFINTNKFYNLDDVERAKNASELMDQYNLREEQKNLFGPWRVYRKDLEEMYSQMEQMYFDLETTLSEDEKIEILNLLHKIEGLVNS